MPVYAQETTINFIKEKELYSIFSNKTFFNAYYEQETTIFQFFNAYYEQETTIFQFFNAYYASTNEFSVEFYT
jgi:hypothetical protein